MRQVLFAVWGVLFSFAIHINAHAENQNRHHQVVIVGGGIGGLVALDQLRQKGIDAVLLEKAPILGGRIRTTKDVHGLMINAGAELIDSSHRALFDLARHLNVRIVRRANPHLQRTFFQFNERWLPQSVMMRAVQNYDHDAIQQIWRDQTALDRIKTRQRQNLPADAYELERNLDQISLSDYLNHLKASPWLQSLVFQLIQSEFGIALEDISALVLFEMMGVEEGLLKVLPYNDEAHFVEGGTERIISGLADRNQRWVHLNHRVDLLKQRLGGTYELRTRNEQGEIDTWTAKYVIMAAPPTANLGIRVIGIEDPRFRQDLNHSQYGHNSKLMLIFQRRTWSPFRAFGADTDTGMGYQMWDGGAETDQNGAVLTVLVGGLLHDAKLAEQMAQRLIEKLELEFPGTQQTYEGFRVYEWAESYPGPLRLGERLWQHHHVDQAANRRGRLFWVGDRWNRDSMGYMNDAVVSALAVSKAVEQDLKPPIRQCERFFVLR